MIKEKLQTIPGGVPMGTDRSRVGGQMPSVQSVGSGQALPYLNGAPASTSPLNNGSDSMSLPMFNMATGNNDSGANFGTASGDAVVAAGQGEGSVDGHGFSA